jgi:cellulose synthase/poly-beta-1,6-N-acetylglucosamine synthase-like glycosyltransferase
MSWWLVIVMLLMGLTVLGCGAAVYWCVVLVQVIRTGLLLPTARDGLGLASPNTGDGAGAEGGPGPRVCVVIPAHNERAMLGRLTRSLVAQDFTSLRVVFALDRCTDDSAAVVREAAGGDPRIEIVEITACPEDWAGKVHAIWSATRASEAARQAELLLFADADTVFDPGCVRACVALLRARGLDLLSLLSTLECHAWFEHIVQPAAGMELLRQYPPLRVNRATHARPFANGQFMLLRREAYERAGGHEAVKDELLEDIALARRVNWTGGRGGLFFADGMLKCRMYESWAQFRRGWKRIYVEGANRSPNRLAALSRRLMITGVLLPTGSALGAACGWPAWWATDDPLGVICGAAGAAGLCAMLLAQLAGARLGGSSLLGTLAYPLGAFLTAGILREASADLRTGRAIEWAGRAYVRMARERPGT